jgi:hypothetical protein
VLQLLSQHSHLKDMVHEPSLSLLKKPFNEGLCCDAHNRQTTIGKTGKKMTQCKSKVTI